MDIDGMFAEHHSRVTSEKVSTATRHLREKGICTYRAPIGYQNLGSMDCKPFDEVRAPIIRKAFERYATGEWSIADITIQANKEGLTTLPMRRRRSEAEMLAEEEEDAIIEKVSRPVTLVHMHKILTNPFYTGKIMRMDGVYIPSRSHAPLISEGLFFEVQKELKRKKVSTHYLDKRPLYHRGFIRCQHCHRVYTPYEQKGIQYFSSRCLKDCVNSKKSFNLKFLEDKIGHILSRLYFTDDEIALLEARTKTDISLLEERRHRDLEANDRMKKKIREDLSYLRGNKLTLLKAGAFTPEMIIAEENRLSAELTSLQNAEQTSDQAMHEVVKDVFKLSELIKDGSEYYSYAESAHKSKIIHVIFSELSLSGDTLQYKVKNGFRAFADRLTNLGDPTGWLSELQDYKDEINMSIRELEETLPSQLLEAH